MSGLFFGGSRSLPSSFFGLVRAVVAAAAPGAGWVSCGCAAGADQAVVAALLALGWAALLRLFCVGAPSGAGFWSGSAPVSLFRAAAAAGASVSWLAGGVLSVPLRARLLRRSLAALPGCSAAVFFLASPAPSGSLTIAAAAVSLFRLPVFVFPCGFSVLPAGLAGCAGAWVPAVFCGFPCLRWAPAACQLSF